MAQATGELGDVSVSRLEVTDGMIEMEMRSEFIGIIADHMASMLVIDGKVMNYVEMRLSNESIGGMVLTLQRVEGKTPHEFRRELEAENLQLRQELEALKSARGVCERCAQLEDELARHIT